MGKEKAHKTISGTSKKNHLRQHLRKSIRKAIKNPKCYIDNFAFQSWKRLNFGGIDELGSFTKVVEGKNGPEVMKFSAAEIEAAINRIHVKGPSHHTKVETKTKDQPPKKRRPVD